MIGPNPQSDAGTAQFPCSWNPRMEAARYMSIYVSRAYAAKQSRKEKNKGYFISQQWWGFLLEMSFSSLTKYVTLLWLRWNHCHVHRLILQVNECLNKVESRELIAGLCGLFNQCSCMDMQHLLSRMRGGSSVRPLAVAVRRKFKSTQAAADWAKMDITWVSWNLLCGPCMGRWHWFWAKPSSCFSL